MVPAILSLLQSDGAVDSAFDLGTGPDDLVFQFKEQPDGRVLVGGRFGNVDGRASPRLVRVTIPPMEPRIPAHLVMQPASVIATQTIASVTLSAGAEGTPPMRCQWYRNRSPLLAANFHPMLLRGPMDVTVSRRTGFREPVVLSAVVQSGTAVEFRWFLNDAQIGGQTKALLLIPDPQPGHSGRYRLEAANSLGMVKAEALVTVVVSPIEAPRLSAEWIPGERPLRLRFHPITGYRYRLESSGNLLSWTPLEDPTAVYSPNEFAPQLGHGPGFNRLHRSREHQKWGARSGTMTRSGLMGSIGFIVRSDPAAAMEGREWRCPVYLLDV